MMVIRGRRTGDSADVIFPADRCTWVQGDSADGNGYVISSVMFHPGNAGAQAVTGTPVLGYIGKSARFVPISDPS